MAKIAQIEVIPIVSPEQSRTDLDGTVQTVIVRYFVDDVCFGLAETDSPAQVFKSFI